MKKRSITVNFECDAPEEVLLEIADHMEWQLESLNDGTLYMGDDEDKTENHVYLVNSVKLK